MRSASRLTRAGTTDRMLFVIGSYSRRRVLPGGPLKRLAVGPRHPLRRAGREFQGVPLEFGQGVERVRAAQLCRVNEAHEQVADLRPVQRPIEQRVPPSDAKPASCSARDSRGLFCTLSAQPVTSAVLPPAS